MSYLRHKTGNVERLVSMDDIRHVECISTRPGGGPPYHDSGRITYTDGTVLEVPFGCASAVLAAFKNRTVPNTTHDKSEPL